jgi:hypothetical protein
MTAPKALHHHYHSANLQGRRIKISPLLLDIDPLLLETDYSSNPTQWVRFSMCPRFCASISFCVIQ